MLHAIHNPGNPSRNPRRSTYARKNRHNGRVTVGSNRHRFPAANCRFRYSPANTLIFITYLSMSGNE